MLFYLTNEISAAPLLAAGFICTLIAAILFFYSNRKLKARLLRRTDRERSLRESEQKYRNLFETSKDAILIIENRQFTDCNQATVEMLGYTEKSELLNVHPSTISPPLQPDGSDSAEKSEKMMDLAVQNGSHRFEWDHLKANGEIIPVEVVLTTISSDPDHLVLHTVWRDISERREAENAIRKERDFIAEILRWTDSIVVVLDLNGYIVTFNHAAERCSGYRFEEVQGRPFWDILLKADEKERIITAFHDIRNPSSANEYENLWLTKNGEERRIHWFKSELKDAAGEVEYLLYTGLDLTEHDQVEKALRQSEAHYQSILENMEEGYFEADLAGNIIEMNKSAVETTGYSRSEILGKDYRKYMDKATEKELFAIYNEIYRTGNPKKYMSYEIIRKDGTRRLIEASASLKLDSDQHPVGFYGISRDVTERRKMNEMMIQAEKMISIGGLAAGIAHEINNPLAVIVQEAQNIQRRLLPDFKKNIDAATQVGLDLELLSTYLDSRGIYQMFRNMQTAGRRVSDIINNMLRFSRKNEYEYSQVKIPTIINRALELASSDYNLLKRFDFKHIDLKVQIDEGLPDIFCVEQQIEQVLLNIIGNAAQALSDRRHADGTPTIIIRAADERRNVRLEIEDNGPGIADEIKNRIFEPFFTTKPTGVGTGLGLSVSYMIITHNHNGLLEADSEIGKGTRFTIKLPYSPDYGSLLKHR